MRAAILARSDRSPAKLANTVLSLAPLWSSWPAEARMCLSAAYQVSNPELSGK